MTMSPENIIAYAEKINTKNIIEAIYYITPINDHITELSNIHLDVYNIPTNKLSDIHAILRMRHPDKDYFIKYCNTIHHNIVTIRSNPHQPTTIFAEPANTDTLGYYTLNMDRIAPIKCDQISIMQALNIMQTQIHEQFNFMDHTPNIHDQKSISDMIYPYKCENISVRYHIYNTRYNQNIHVNIHTYHQNILVYKPSFFCSPNNIHHIDTSITQNCNNILAHIQHHPDIYCGPHSSQHQYIALLRAAEHYFAQPNHSLRASIRQALHNFQQHYTYHA